MNTTKVGALLCAIVLTGCAGGGGQPEGSEADPVMAGKRYVNAPMSLGPVKMMLRLREGAASSDAALGPQNVTVSLGFRARIGTAKVILSDATLAYGDGKAGEVVTRHESLGTSDGCGFEPAAQLPPDYWFNAAVSDTLWSCVTLGIVTPGRMAADTLDLTLEPLNVNGEIIRVLPVTFAARLPE